MNDSFEVIYKDLNINEDEAESELQHAIEQRVLELLERDPDLLMSYLYRLDIEEQKINVALLPNPEYGVHTAIALLILERQKQRMETKRKYKVEPIDGWED